MSPAQSDAIKEIIDLFDKAEDKIKEVEQLSQNLSIPSINELRYAGYHLARSYTEEDPKKLDIQIDKAKRHCMRAIYDAHEMGIIDMLKLIKVFKEEYTQFSTSVLEVIPTYTEKLSTANKASRFIAQIKENHRDNREAYYNDCEPHYKALRDIVDNLSEAEPLVNKNITERKENDRIQTRRFVITVLLSLLALTVSIFIGTIIIYLNLSG